MDTVQRSDSYLGRPLYDPIQSAILRELIGWILTTELDYMAVDVC